MRVSSRTSKLYAREERLFGSESNLRIPKYVFEAPENSIASLAVENVNSRWPIFTHFNFWRRVWEYVIFVVSISCLFEITFIPIFVPEITFKQYSPLIILDVLYILDLYVVTHTSYLSHGVVVRSPKRIVKRYGKFAIICHCIGVIPLNWLGCIGGKWWMHVLCSIPRLFRLRRTTESLDTIRGSLVYFSWFSQLFPLMIFLANLIHFFACIFYLAAFFEPTYDCWITNLGWDKLAIPQQYVVSIYFVMTTILTIGFGDLTPQSSSERIVVIFIQLIGVMMNAYMVGTMVSFLIDPIGQRFLTNFSGCSDYMKFKGIPKDVRVQVMHVFQDKWDKYKGSDEPRQVFRHIPETVRNHLKLDIARKCFSVVPPMNLASERLLVGLANVMKPVAYCPGETIIEQDRIDPTLYLFKSGVIQVFLNGVLFATNNCDSGIGFGELELFIDQPRTATVKAVTYVEGWTISRDDLVMGMSHQSDLRTELLQTCKMVFPNYYKQIRRLFNIHLKDEQITVPTGQFLIVSDDADHPEHSDESMPEIE